jgi:Na+/H+ antiporter NhaD/arsenite permease-like protein
MLLFGIFRGFYSEEEAIHSIEFNTLLLLFGMMIIVSILRRTGLFTYLAIKSAKAAKGKPWRLLVLMGGITAFTSMILDNVTSIVLMVPITILISETLAINPTPILIAEALLSNIGGVGTLVGDPPNIMISQAAGFSFNDFLIHLLPPVLVVLVISLIALMVVFRKELRERPGNIDGILKMDEQEAIRERGTLRKCLLVLLVVCVLFLLQELIGLSSSFIAVIGATMILLLVRPNLEEIFREVEWSILIFFASLFIVVGGIERVGILPFIGAKVVSLANEDMMKCTLCILWSSALLSSIFDNIPFTITMLPLIKRIGLEVSANPMWWALALGVGLGGNGTPIGSAAGVVTLTIGERARYPITFGDWVKSGTLITLLSCGVVSILLILFPQAFE